MRVALLLISCQVFSGAAAVLYCTGASSGVKHSVLATCIIYFQKHTGASSDCGV